MSPELILLYIAVGLVGTVLVSFVVEAIRRPPVPPAVLPWAPEIPLQYVEVGGVRLRYLRTGQGPDLVLLHTIRTSLDLYQKMIPALSRRFTVWAVDYPGHGYSDIPDIAYAPADFQPAVEGFLDHTGLRGATVAGISIGGTIALLAAARGHPAVGRVVAINPYDYARGTGVRRGNAVANLVMSLATVPVLGETVMRLRLPVIERWIMEGGVATPDALSAEFLADLFAQGERRSHYRAFLNLIRHAAGWEDAPAQYGRIRVPVLLVYGERDWSRPAERRRTGDAIPGVRELTITDGGHFLALDRPVELETAITEFALAGRAATVPPARTPA